MFGLHKSTILVILLLLCFMILYVLCCTKEGFRRRRRRRRRRIWKRKTRRRRPKRRKRNRRMFRLITRKRSIIPKPRIFKKLTKIKTYQSNRKKKQEKSRRKKNATQKVQKQQKSNQQKKREQKPKVKKTFPRLKNIPNVVTIKKPAFDCRNYNLHVLVKIKPKIETYGTPHKINKFYVSQKNSRMTNDYVMNESMTNEDVYIFDGEITQSMIQNCTKKNVNRVHLFMDQEIDYSYINIELRSLDQKIVFYKENGTLNKGENKIEFKTPLTLKTNN